MRMAFLFLILCITATGLVVRSFNRVKSFSLIESLALSMFSGIVEEIGTIDDVNKSANVQMWDGTVSEGFIIRVSGKATLTDAYIGCSIALNGVCLTVTELDNNNSKFSFGISPETLRRSNIKSLAPGSKVNLERALKNDGRNSGHVVQGHVDCTGTILDKWSDGDSLFVKVQVPAQYLKYIVSKGFVAVDGTSLTVCEVGPGWFTFMLVPHTQQR